MLTALLQESLYFSDPYQRKLRQTEQLHQTTLIYWILLNAKIHFKVSRDEILRELNSSWRRDKEVLSIVGSPISYSSQQISHSYVLTTKFIDRLNVPVLIQGRPGRLRKTSNHDKNCMYCQRLTSHLERRPKTQQPEWIKSNQLKLALLQTVTKFHKVQIQPASCVALVSLISTVSYNSTRQTQISWQLPVN